MDFPLKKKWIDRRDLSQVVGIGSCLVFKEGNEIITACNDNGKIKIEKHKL